MMDTTEQRAGFRLPWSDRREPPAPDDGGGGPPEDAEANQMQHDMEIPPPEDATAPSVDDAQAGDATTDGGAPAAAPDAAPARRPSRFLAELTRAMHAAAEEGRVATLDQLRADGKTAVEEIQSRSADGATSIRRNADEDVTRIREWSKAEIARIREETEQRIAARKVELDRDLEGHAAVVEAEIENVQGQVSAFEAEMDAFFEKLIAEEDPGRFAALAASLPEPPPFTPLSETERAAVVARATGTGVVEESPEGAAAEPAAEAMAVVEVGEAEAEAIAVETQGATVAVQAEGETVAETTQSPPTEDGGEWASDAEATEAGDVDPRLAALPDLADAERDALADVSASEADGDGAADGSISARLAGLTAPVHPAAAEAAAESGPVETSQVVVTGLTSVSSIAAFKRQLGRLDGVRSVAVSSGPSGEFVFAVTHAPGVQLADGVTSLGGFSPQIGRVEPGLVELTARDPEA